jgi:endonuclease-3
MTKTEKVNFVIKTLKDFYPEIPIPLDHKDPYTLLIAVLLSAQCTDVRVNQITPLLEIIEVVFFRLAKTSSF